MPRKKKVASRRFTSVQEFYVRGHIGKRSVPDIALDLGVPTEDLEAYIAANDIKPAPPKKPNKFVGKGGAVAMTQNGSMDDARLEPFPENKQGEKFLAQFANDIARKPEE